MKRYFIGLLHAAVTGAMGALVSYNFGAPDWHALRVAAISGALGGVYGWIQRAPRDQWDGSTERRATSAREKVNGNV